MEENKQEDTELMFGGFAERILKAFGEESNARKISEKTGISIAQLSRILNKENFGIVFLYKIITALPEVSIVWLITGEGNMLKTKEEEEKTKEYINSEKAKLKVSEMKEALVFAQIEIHRVKRENAETQKRMDSRLSKYESIASVNEVLQKNVEDLRNDKAFLMSQLKS